MQQDNEDVQHLIQAPMSDIWRELLGNSAIKIEIATPGEEAEVPTLKSDPWSELLQSRDVEIINVQQVHLHMTDRDVELALQFMQEDSVRDAASEQ
ncbi:MAG: hypothetical protein H0V70_05770 [Ktedonobacteraceae bacterium]|nr:hypothetical protein [Ktedonobacteraceae bacterium]